MSTNWSNQVILSRFRVEILLPGESEAYRAWDNQSSQPVILHLLPEMPDDETGHQLENRGRELAHFSHASVSPYLGYFEFSGRAFWVEGYFDAPTLRDVLSSTSGQPLPLTERLGYVK
jgi:hypothetical protein